MEVQFLGANCRKGTSEKTGQDYAIAELAYMVPDESSVKKGEDGRLIWNYVAYGAKVRTLPLDPDALARFRELKPGQNVKLDLQPNPNNPTRNRVVGIQ